MFCYTLRLLLSCGNPPIPKAEGYYRIELPEESFNKTSIDCGLTLDKPDYSKLEIIEASKLDARDCLTDMLRLWLNKMYNVEKYGEPSWETLREAVRSPARGDAPAIADN